MRCVLTMPMLFDTLKSNVLKKTRSAKAERVASL
jgi:hypothetical protein